MDSMTDAHEKEIETLLETEMAFLTCIAIFVFLIIASTLSGFGWLLYTYFLGCA
jgi:cell division septal protein FtsQ